MEKKRPDEETLFRFEIIRFQFIGIVILAFILWGVKDFVASFAATEQRTTTTLRTTEERDDARVLRAFESTKRNAPLEVELVTESNPQQQTRDAVLTITGPTKKEVLDAREMLVKEMQTTFASEGTGELFDIGPVPSATPVPNHAMSLIRLGFMIAAGLLLVMGLLIVFLQWKRTQLPKVALLGIAATALVIALVYLDEDDGGPFRFYLVTLGLPLAVLAVLGYLTRRVQKAAAWQEGSARIIESKVKAERHRFQGDTTKVRNLAQVRYNFEAAGWTIQSDRISIGFAPADQVDETLKRYPVGATVPVFYDPKNPEDCVLERNAPVSLGCLWSVALVVFALYVAGMFGALNTASLHGLLETLLPGVQHPLLVLITGLLSLFCFAAFVWNRLHPSKTEPWPRTRGTIVSSATESYRESDYSSSPSTHTFYKAVIEFRYQVEGQEYHTTNDATDIVTVSIAGSKTSADAEAKQYQAGQEVDVFYHPKNPTRASLQEHKEITITGNRSLVVSIILLAIAVYMAMHG